MRRDGVNGSYFDRRRVLESLGAFTLLSYAGRGMSTDSPRPGPSDRGSSGALSCVVTPSATEGPYFVDEALNRSDLRSGTRAPAVLNGLPLALEVSVYRASDAACSPLAGAQIDVWHADAAGVYSDLAPEGTVGEKYLRGYQLTDASGAASFTTIYPGWYSGRTPHIHFKVRTGNVEFTSQWFFDDEVSDLVYAAAPYSNRGPRNRRNGSDRIYKSPLLLPLERGAANAGYVGKFSIGLKF